MFKSTCSPVARLVTVAVSVGEVAIVAIRVPFGS